MNKLRPWLESHLPAFFRPAETTVHVDIAGVELTLRDWQGSNVLAIVPKEILDDDYKLRQIDFRPGDVVIDIGANIGIVALYLAKKHPGIQIIAIEPVPTTFRHLEENLWLNGVSNITALNCAVTKDGRDLTMIVNPGHSGVDRPPEAHEAAGALQPEGPVPHARRGLRRVRAGPVPAAEDRLRRRGVRNPDRRPMPPPRRSPGHRDPPQPVPVLAGTYTGRAAARPVAVDPARADRVYDDSDVRSLIGDSHSLPAEAGSHASELSPSG
jgi:hypothetical protein